MIDFEQKIIPFESLDGGGKTTHIKRMAEDLEEMGLRVAIASSPGKGMIGNTLRAHIGDLSPSDKNRLFTYDIERQQRQVPGNADVVFWDRYLDSIVASNDGNKEEVNAFATKIARPAKTVYIDISPEISWEREGGNSDHPLDKGWLEEKHKRYQQLLHEDPDRFVVIDGSKPLEEVYYDVFDYVAKEMQPKIEKHRIAYNTLLDTPGVVRFLIDNPAEVKPGVFLPMFINLKRTWQHSDVRTYFSDELAQLIGNEYDWIIGLESGGSFYATSVATKLNLPLSLLRKSEKQHGNLNLFLAGDVPPAKSRVAFIDDVYATGQAAFQAANKLKQLQCETSFYSIFSYSNDVEMSDRLGFGATSLTYFKALRHMAKNNGMISAEQEASLTEQVDAYRNTVYQ